MNKPAVSLTSAFGQICLVAAGIGASTMLAHAQPSMSRGQQLLQVNSTECLNRALQALRNVGFSASTAGNFAQGFKEISGAYIMCNDAPGGGTWVNIVVASGTNDSGVPGQLRQLLQAQMNQPGSGTVTGGTPSSGSMVGTWTLKCCTGEFQWTMTIRSQNGTAFSGVLSAEASGGDINGQVRGGSVEFVRSGTWGKQTWRGQIVNDRGVLRMSGTWTGDYQERFPGRNEWSAEKR